MDLFVQIRNSIKFRTRYLLFSKLGFPGTSITSLLFEKLVSKLDLKLFRRHKIRLSLALKPDGDEQMFNDSSFAVIYHGKIINWDYLHLNLIRMRRSCPESLIVLSTYTDDVTAEIKSVCEENDVALIQISEPGQLAPPFATNFLRGVSSAFAGMSYASQLGSKWGMKIRVDQDISRKSGIKFVSDLLSGRILAIDNDRRVIGTSYNTYSSLPIFLSDMLQFGKLETLLEYWKPINSRDISQFTDEIFSNADEELSNWKFVPEVWLAGRYLHSLGFPIRSVSQVNQIFWRELGGVVDSTTLGQNWVKTLDAFDSNYASIKWFEESYSKQYLEFHFSDWTQVALD